MNYLHCEGQARCWAAIWECSIVAFKAHRVLRCCSCINKHCCLETWYFGMFSGSSSTQPYCIYSDMSLGNLLGLYMYVSLYAFKVNAKSMDCIYIALLSKVLYNIAWHSPIHAHTDRQTQPCKATASLSGTVRALSHCHSQPPSVY